MGKAYRLNKGLIVCVALLLSSLQSFASEADFPAPENIRPAIDFWVRVYTEVDTNSGFLHDSENLSVIYASLSRDVNSINRRRKQIADDLKVLATGKRTQLSSSQTNILALWPHEVTNERLERAAGNVRWQLGQSDRFMAGLKRSGAYRRHIEAVVNSKNMPIELVVLPHVESSFHPGAYSSAAATGMWQFVRSTAQRFMRVDFVVDDRLDPYRATYGAMELLEFNYNALGTWPLALTAYNHGANGMARAVKAVGTTNIGKIINEYKGPSFGFASRNFYPQFLAVLEVEKRKDEFFGSLEYDRDPEFTEFEMTSYVDARILATSLGVSMNDLKRDNPALQPSIWSGTKLVPKGYKVKVDRASFRGDLTASLNRISVADLYSEQIPDISYKVRRGDSLSLIAERYKTRVSDLVAINQLRDRHRIRIGQVLLLPQPDVGVLALAAAVNNADPWEVPEDGQYIVQLGDTLSLISDRFRVPEDTLLSLNGLSNRNLIYPGQALSLTALQGGAELIGELDPVQETAELAEAEQTQINQLVEEGQGPAVPQLASLSVDSDNKALEVDAVVQQAEEQQQLITDLSADPSDYTVAADASIEIQAVETLGHYADWLGIRAWDLRRLNNMVYGQPVISGNRLKLDFSKQDIATFETRRRQFHRDLQAQYFDNWRIKGTEKYSIRSRDLLVNLTRQRSVPLWLFLQYNPDVDTGRIQIGQEVVFPQVERVEI